MTEPSNSSSSRAEPRRKRHHYVPESYLKAWADESGQVAVRRRDRAAVFPTATRNAAVEADLYAFPTDGGLDDALEKELSKIEAPLRGHLADLRDGRMPRKGTAVRAEISHLLALQLVRTPEHLDSLMFPLNAAQFTGERPVSREGMRRFLAEEYLGEPPREPEIQGALAFTNVVLSKGELTKREIFSMLFQIAEEELAPRLAAMAWAVEMSSQRAFVTTDRPVAVWRRDPHNLKRMGAGLESADEVRFPLGPHHLLVLRPRFPEHRTVIEPDRAAQVNLHLAAACYEMVIGRTADGADLERLKLRRVRPAMRFNTGPLFETDVNGRSVPTGREVLHMYVPYGDNADGD